MAIYKIALTAGHYMQTPGKRCLKSLDPKETREWWLNNRICDKIEALLKSYTGYALLRTDDTTGKKYVSLDSRVSAANKWGADEYYSVHHNAGVNGGKGGGIVAFVCTKARSASIEMQKELYDALIAATGLRGNRYTPLAKKNLYEVCKTTMPAVLLELGFMDSSTDVPIILTEEYADQCAAAIVSVMVKRGNLKKKASTSSSSSGVKIDAAKEFHEYHAGTYRVNASEGLNLRSGASTSKTRIEVMPGGSKFVCYGYHTGGWLYGVSASGKKGFCDSRFLVKVK